MLFVRLRLTAKYSYLMPDNLGLDDFAKETAFKLEERDQAVCEYAKQHPRLGVPNLFIAELWKDEEYAAKIICGPAGRLSVDQVRAIRELNDSGMPVEKIMERTGASSLDQVERVLLGKTYSRIH